MRKDLEEDPEFPSPHRHNYIYPTSSVNDLKISRKDLPQLQRGGHTEKTGGKKKKRQEGWRLQQDQTQLGGTTQAQRSQKIRHHMRQWRLTLENESP